MGMPREPSACFYTLKPQSPKPKAQSPKRQTERAPNPKRLPAAGILSRSHIRDLSSGEQALCAPCPPLAKVKGLGFTAFAPNNLLLQGLISRSHNNKEPYDKDTFFQGLGWAYTVYEVAA